MKKLSKLPSLLGSIGRSPSEFCDRVRAIIEVQLEERSRDALPTYRPLGVLEAMDLLERALSRQVRGFFAENDLTKIETEVSHGLKDLKGKSPFSLEHNADIELGRFCYAVSRALSAAVILESGVAYGVTTAYLLQAIDLNGTGKLWSIDLPPLGRHAEEHVGFLVPSGLRRHWNLRRGVTRRLLPALLPTLGSIDLFVQDSLHTYKTISDELDLVWPYLSPGGVVIADDIGDNRAFEDFTDRVKPSSYMVIQELHKDSMFGIIVKGSLPCYFKRGES